ncbi:MAG: hypothetical protein ACFFFC_19505 [Candidatus Thorarchaeota archaeon]
MTFYELGTIAIMKLHKSMICLIFLLVRLIVYYLLAELAILSYPGGFDLYNDLWTHLRWLGYNPDGAMLFRICSEIYALSLVVLVLSASGWIIFATEKKRAMYPIFVPSYIEDSARAMSFAVQ